MTGRFEMGSTIVLIWEAPATQKILVTLNTLDPLACMMLTTILANIAHCRTLWPSPARRLDLFNPNLLRC